jgi:hypothetical protein
LATSNPWCRFIHLLVCSVTSNGISTVELSYLRCCSNILQIQAVKRSRGVSWEEVRTRVDPAVKQKKGWTTPKL